MNLFVAVGRMGVDPEMRYTPDGRAFTRFRLAVDQPPRNGERETLWLTVLSFGRLAEQVNDLGQKGRLVLVQGRLRVRTYEDREGNPRTAVEVIADRVRFLDRPAEVAAEAEAEAVEADEVEEPGEEPEAGTQREEGGLWLY